MSEFLDAALRLHSFLHQTYWRDCALIGPDNAVRFNRRLGRFVKSYLSFIPWNDDLYSVQGQGYWILSNWALYDLIHDQTMADLAAQCALGILERQRPEGYWEYPQHGWAGRIATVECVFGGIGMLESYERTQDPALLAGVLQWYDYLVDHVGFQPSNGNGLSVNYFAEWPTSLVPNNTTLVLAFLGRLAQVTKDASYLQHCPALIAFLKSVQMGNGEFPYAIKNSQGEGQGRVHFQCFQYHAFQLQDLAMYYEATHDASVLPLITNLARFLAPSVKPDGSTQFDCADSGVRMPYNTAAIAAALGIARKMGLRDEHEAENRAYSYVLSQQHPNGGFAFSHGDYHLLSDRRYYPRPMTMILYHLLLKAAEIQLQTRGIT
jgi:hypothetical protein